MRKARMLYLLGVLSICVFHFGSLFRPGGLSDGGFW
jgi:hypothetical protein